MKETIFHLAGHESNDYLDGLRVLRICTKCLHDWMREECSVATIRGRLRTGRFGCINDGVAPCPYVLEHMLGVQEAEE